MRYGQGSVWWRIRIRNTDHGTATLLYQSQEYKVNKAIFYGKKIIFPTAFQVLGWSLKNQV